MKHFSRICLLLVLTTSSGLALAAKKADPDVVALNQRLQVLQRDPALAELAPYERLQAQQAVATLGQAKKKERELFLFLAQRRVEIAEAAAATAVAGQELARLDGVYRDLQVQESRQQAAQALAEAERQRVLAQLQAEEAERLRLEAEAEAAAREEAEQTLTTVTTQQAARLTAAQRKEAELAREEAELVSGERLPASKFDNRGEVFTLAGEVFETGSARLTEAGNRAIAALGAYLEARPRAKARIHGYGEQELGQQRANSLRDALVAAGVPRTRLQAADAKRKAAPSRAAELVVTP